MSLSVRALVAAAAAASLLTACGSGETAGSGTPAAASSPAATTSAAPADNGVAALSAEEILGKAKAALAAADAVRIKGTADDDGTQVEVEVRYGPDKALGTFALDGLQLEFSRIGDDVYLKAGRGFWTEYANAEVARKVAGKYIRTTRDDERFRDLSDFTDLKTSAYDFLDLSGPLTKGGATTEAGRPAIEVTDKSDDGGTLYVATTGEPYPLSVRSGSDEVTFSDFGTPVTVPVPPAAQVLDASTLPDE